MPEFTATIEWNRQGAAFADKRFSRLHTWHFDGGITLPASASPHVVPAPYSSKDAVDPEEALVASLSACHMLSFLFIAAKQGYCVDSYSDKATGVIEKNSAGKYWVSRVTLKPQIVFSGERKPNDGEFNAMHHTAHEECFIANSVKTEVTFEPTILG
jgi:organic hydroperoxide reductase OsmC/OhrA